MPTSVELRGTVRALLPGLTEDLVRLMAVPSVAVRGYPASCRRPLSEAMIRWSACCATRA